MRKKDKNLKKKFRNTDKRRIKTGVLKNRDNILTGRFAGTSGGFGFVKVEGFDKDFFISNKDRLNAFDNDIVEITPYKYHNGKRREAKVISIKERSEKNIVGLFKNSGNFGFVEADSVLVQQDIYIAKHNFKGAVDDDKVVVKIIDYGDSHKNPEGVVVEVLGNADTAGIDVLSVIREFGAETDFDEKVAKQAKNVAKPITQSDIEFRLDLRDILTVTIDGEDSKDLDDAISLEKLDDGFRLYVHIADVANYVQEGSALDKEALKRAVSIYPVDRVIPMLPVELSNGICSLNKGEDRLALTCIMSFDKDGNMLEYDIRETVINVDERLCYNQVAALFDKEDIKLPKNVISMLKLMKRLSAKLNKKRAGRGYVDFNFKESKIILDENNVAVDVVIRDRNVATNIIEEFMLVTNETVAYHFREKRIPFVYRIHENPSEEKMEILKDICSRLFVPFRTKRDGIKPKDIARLIEKTRGSDVEMTISRMALRSMQQARYSTECTGHFGLASVNYCHFTSPIRRYPDLQIHRIIREYLHNKLNDKRIEHYNKILDRVAEHSSKMERKSVDIERKTEKIKKAEYMEKYHGFEFDGLISGITGGGIFVELENTVEGMVSVDTMNDDRYEYDEKNMSLIGIRTGRSYSFGDRVSVQVGRVDKVSGNIDFVLTR